MRTYTSYYGNSTASPAYSDGMITRVVNNNLTDNLNWAMDEINQSIRYLVTKYYFNERSYSTVTASGTQFYNLPPQVKKLINITALIGSTLWQPKECPSREYWDYLNTISFNQDYPSFFFVYDGQVGLWPTPASSSNAITMHYKTRIADLSMADVTSTTASTTVSVTTNTTTVTAAGSAFKAWMAGQWIRIPHSSTDAANGDNQWYQIDSVTSATVLVLKNKYTGATVTGGNFTVGEVSLLPEDYQDLPYFRMATVYYSGRGADSKKFAQFDNLYKTGFEALDDEFGSKTTNVILPDTSMPVFNPNLFQSGLSQA